MNYELKKPKLILEKHMDDIFKSKDDAEREEKINNLFRSAKSIEDIKETKPLAIPESEKIFVEESPKKNWKFLINIFLVVIFLGLAGATGYFWWQYKKVAQNPPIAPVVDETAVIVEKVKNLTDLPPENPVLATIASQTESATQPLFPSASEGDKVLIYIQAKKAVLYRPASEQVIETVALSSSQTMATAENNSTENAQEPLVSEKITTKVKVDVLNGTEIKGLAKATADKLAGMENVEVAKTGNAQKSTYTKILVVDLSGKNAVAAKIIAAKVGGEVGVLPAGEEKGTADILIIVGK